MGERKESLTREQYASNTPPTDEYDSRK